MTLKIGNREKIEGAEVSPCDTIKICTSGHTQCRGIVWEGSEG